MPANILEEQAKNSCKFSKRDSYLMNIYFISGLGADRRAFERLKLPSEFSLHYLDWIKPQKKESLNAYAKRLADAIDTSKPFAIVGLSMGGMIASAMTQFLHPYKTILISSVACNKEFPPLFRMARRFGLHKLLPLSFFTKPNAATYWLFGAKSKNEKALMHYIISHSDPQFVKWAIGAILSWDCNERSKNVFHIHGSNDKILPVKYTKPDEIIKGGSHFMVWTKAGEVSRLLTNILSE